jgi:subtilisin family serine protease
LTTFFGLNNVFSGTSAAAPHAAAIAALLKSKQPSPTSPEIHTALITTALDIGPSGVDRDSGYGIVMAPTALNALTTYIGVVDSLGCDVIRGWAADRNRLNTPINVAIYDGSTLLTTALANQSRPDVAAILGDNGLHGFNITTPAA